MTNHAEIVVMRLAQRMLKTNNLSDYTIYTNYEPCAMCAFMIRELQFKRVVFSLNSEDMGGYTKWEILQNKELEQLRPHFTSPPTIIKDILATEAKRVFDKREEQLKKN